MSRVRLGFVLAALAIGCGDLYSSQASAGEDQLGKLRATRKPLNEKGNASEFAGRWRMKLPAGFEYDVQLKQLDNGLLRMTCPGHALNLLGDFVCIGTELQLVEPRQERIDDYIWAYRDGQFVLTKDEQHHGGHYLGATLTRLPQ
jgi:hypothetical protein